MTASTYFVLKITPLCQVYTGSSLSDISVTYNKYRMSQKKSFFMAQTVL